MVGGSIRNICALLLTAGLVLVAAPAGASDKGWDKASSLGRDALIVAALGVPAIQQDWSGDLQAAGSILAAEGVSYGLKHIFPERRPDRSDNRSFPSGHASLGFAAAASLENRYGWTAGLPAFLVATFVGVARVQAHKHHWYDAAAGAALGTTSGFLITSRHDDSVRMVPWADSKSGGLALRVRF